MITADGPLPRPCCATVLRRLLRIRKNCSIVRCTPTRDQNIQHLIIQKSILPYPPLPPAAWPPPSHLTRPVPVRTPLPLSRRHQVPRAPPAIHPPPIIRLVELGCKPAQYVRIRWGGVQPAESPPPFFFVTWRVGLCLSAGMAAWAVGVRGVGDAGWGVRWCWAPGAGIERWRHWGRWGRQSLLRWVGSPGAEEVGFAFGFPAAVPGLGALARLVLCCCYGGEVPTVLRGCAGIGAAAVSGGLVF